MAEGMMIPRLYVGVDRQDYVVNWSRRSDRRNVTLSAVGSADNRTGYVFGMHLNYDANLDAAQIESDADTTGDCDLPGPRRQYARQWLSCDYEQAVSNKRNKVIASGKGLTGDIERAYQDSDTRSDVESPEHPSRTNRLPLRAMQIHAEYTLYGHFLLLRSLFCGVEMVRFFLDQDSGIRAFGYSGSLSLGLRPGGERSTL